MNQIQKYPMTFVIQSNEKVESLKKKIQNNANKTYSIKAIVEEIINIPILNIRFKEVVEQGCLT